MLRALRALPADGFVVALLAVVALATVLPATGAFGDVLSVATKVVIALLFAQRGWQGTSLVFTIFGLSFILARVFFSPLPDRIGGAKVALVCALQFGVNWVLTV